MLPTKALCCAERLPCCCVDSTACDDDDEDDAAAVAEAVMSAPTGGGKQRNRLALRVLNAQVAKMQREVRRQASTAVVGASAVVGATASIVKSAREQNIDMNYGQTDATKEAVLADWRRSRSTVRSSR